MILSFQVESLKRFYEPQEIHNPKMILIVGALGLLVNLLGLCLFHEHGHSHGGGGGGGHGHSHLTALADDADDEPPKSAEDGKGAKNSNGGGASQMNMRGVFLHVLADALGSVVVIISALIMWKTDWEYKIYVDPGLSLVLVVIMMRGVWPLLIESALILLQTAPAHIDVETLKKKLLESIEGVLAVHEFHVWQLTGERIIVSAHIRCLNLSEYMKVRRELSHSFILPDLKSLFSGCREHQGVLPQRGHPLHHGPARVRRLPPGQGVPHGGGLRPGLSQGHLPDPVFPVPGLKVLPAVNCHQQVCPEHARVGEEDVGRVRHGDHVYPEPQPRGNAATGRTAKRSRR